MNYHGPDADYAGAEILFGGQEGRGINIVDVTDKANPLLVALESYPGRRYAHQGWLSEDHRLFFHNDELDATWTHRWDVTDLDAPVYLGTMEETAGTALDHNLYVKGRYVFQANYAAGVRVMEIADATDGTLNEVAWLDTYPENDIGDASLCPSIRCIGFKGAWSVYPFFDSGTIISSDINRGLFVSRVDSIPADFNADGRADCTDIDQLVNAIVSGSTQPWFDLNEDGELDLEDRDAWLALAGGENLSGGTAYLVGDINLDGTVDGGDFLVWNANKFAPSPAWCDGDLDASGTIDGADFLLWNASKFQSSDFSGLPGESAHAVPEPISASCSLLLLALWSYFRRFSSRPCGAKVG